MSDEREEITGIHSLPLAVRPFAVSISEKHQSLKDSHTKLEKEVVNEIKPKVLDIHTDIKAVKTMGKILLFLVTLLAAIGGGHLALIHH